MSDGSGGLMTVERERLESQLEYLDAPALRRLVLSAAGEFPGIVRWILTAVHTEIHSSAPGTPASCRPGCVPRIDVPAFQRSARALFRGLGWDLAASAAAATESLVEQIRPYVEAGEGRVALQLLAAAVVAIAEPIDDLDDSDGAYYDGISSLGEVLAEAALCADVTPQDREDWQAETEEVLSALGNYGYDSALEMGLQAITEGWEDPAVVAALRGDPILDPAASTEAGPLDGRSGADAASLVRLRLHVLERQERWTESLNLSHALGARFEHAWLLLRQDRPQEALDYSRAYFTRPDEALLLAQAFAASGAADAAIQIGLEGLRRPFAPRIGIELARWLRDFATAYQVPAAALEAGVALVQETVLFDNYVWVEAQAGDQWDALRVQILEAVRNVPYPKEELAKILLYERLYEEAIELANTSRAPELVASVVDGVRETHSDWAIAACRYQFNQIADPGRSKYYPAAADWVRRIRGILGATDRMAEWGPLVGELITTHVRKRSLRPLLEALR